MLRGIYRNCGCVGWVVVTVRAGHSGADYRGQSPLLQGEAAWAVRVQVEWGTKSRLPLSFAFLASFAFSLSAACRPPTADCPL
jgi:hypothetical protein